MNRDKPAISLLVFALCSILAVLCPGNNDAAEGRKPPPPRADADPMRLAIGEAAAIAVTRNLRMTDARLAVDEKEHQNRSAFSDFFPSLNLQYLPVANRYQQLGNIQAFAGSHDSRWNVRFGAGGLPIPGIGLPDYPYRIDPYRTFTLVGTLTQPIYSGGKLLNNYKFTRLGVDYSAIQWEVERQDLILEVNEAYYSLIQSQKLLEVANQSILSLEALRNQTMEFYKAGVVPKVDVLATEGQLATARIQKTQAETDIERYRANLNFLLRYPQETPTEVVHDYAYRPSGYRVPEIYAVAAANRLEIRQASISVEQALALVRAAQADLIPNIALQIQGSRTNDDWNTFDRESINDWQITGVFTWAFDMFRSRETVKEKRVGQARAFVNRELLVEQIMQDVKLAYEDMKRSESNIFDNQRAVEYRKENFRINRERYKEQVTTYTEVLDAQRQLSQAEGDYYISLCQYRINRAVLERRMGTLRQ